MTDSSSKLLQIQGKRYPERKPKNNPKPEQKKQERILNPVDMSDRMPNIMLDTALDEIPDKMFEHM